MGSNPVRKVKFFQEINLGFRILTREEEQRFLANATPYIQDIAVFALNTGLRIGEILSLTWESVDLENNLFLSLPIKLTKFAPFPLTRMRGGYWNIGLWGGKSVRFLQPRNRKSIRRSQGGFRFGVQKNRNRRCDVAYATPHVRVQACGSRRGYSDSPAIARTFDSHRNHALHAHKSRRKTKRDAKTGRF